MVRHQYLQALWILAGVIGGMNTVFYFLCLAFHWKWQMNLLADLVPPLLGMVSYAWEIRKPWFYAINEQHIKLFVFDPKSRSANLTELTWKKTEVVAVEQDEWQGLPRLNLKVLPDLGHTYALVYSHDEDEEIRTKVLPLIEKYRHQYRHELWADKLRS